VRYVKQLAPKKIVLVHGDLPAVEWTRAQLALELPGSEIIVPAPGVELDL
jgi:Cft2 family RNA processing exonuclease